MAAVFLTAACFDAIDGLPPDNTPCNVEVSGALTANAGCTPRITGLWRGLVDSTHIAGGLGTPAISVSLYFKGTPTLGTFTHADAGALGSVMASSGGNSWIASTAGIPGAPAQQATGSWTITITQAYEGTATANAQQWVVHGTLNATLTAQNAGGSNVVVKIDF
jgi:hypothetical protein